MVWDLITKTFLGNECPPKNLHHNMLTLMERMLQWPLKLKTAPYVTIEEVHIFVQHLIISTISLK